MNNEIVGVIYILTNPSFPNYVKIGYTNDIETRLNKLNSSEAVPFAFRKYATYEVEKERVDKVLHKIIDNLNSNLRSVDIVDDKIRTREFYLMNPEDAYELLEDIAIISGTMERLHKYAATKEELEDEKVAKRDRELAWNRHHFKEITFCSSLTNKKYYSKTNEDGNLGIYEYDTNREVPSRNNPSKKQIVLQAILDLKGNASNDESLYQLEHKLEKLILDKTNK